MAAVAESVLNWLYSVLTSDYRDANRTYSNVAETLSHFPSLKPRTNVYTYENGESALLLVLNGTLPVQFRGNTYRFPIQLWVPHAYPHAPPIVYAVPAADQIIRPGQHVSAEGKVYHPYLAQWAKYWDKSSILDFLSVLRGVFAKEPPVISKQQLGQASPAPQAPPPVPPPPSEWRQPHLQSSQLSPSPQSQQPPRPPKESEGSQASRQESGPPLPPLPPGLSGQPSQDSRWHQNDPQRHNGAAPNASRESRSDIPSRYSQPLSPPPPGPSLQTQYQSQPLPPPSQQQWQHPSQQVPSHQYPPQNQQPYPGPPNPGHQGQHGLYPAQQQPAPTLHRPAPDLMDTPLEVTLPSQMGQTEPIVAPPIPPNPEKDGLLRAVSAILCEKTRQAINENVSAIAPLQAQQQALRHGHAQLQSELEQIQQLDAALTSNDSVLHGAMREADRVMEQAHTRTVPDVDDVLVAPTVVGGQLYTLCAEERAASDAIFILGRALDQGRIASDVFLKQTRSLAREQFLKKALIKKIAKGMGLEEDGRRVT